MPVEAHRLVLREHQNLAQAAVEAVGEREIDDPIHAAERHGRLGPIARQRLQPRAFAAGQNYRQHVVSLGLSVEFVMHYRLLPGYRPIPSDWPFYPPLQ